MKNEQLQSILLKIDINECEEIIRDYIYYIKKLIKQRVNHGDGRFSYEKEEHEFLIIAHDMEKQAIILRCGNVDLHWYVLKKWRKKHILSNALRTGVINQIWPENKTITCSYDWSDDMDKKYSLTKHFANIANLTLK